MTVSVLHSIQRGSSYHKTVSDILKWILRVNFHGLGFLWLDLGMNLQVS
jgi:hypothetical protein